MIHSLIIIRDRDKCITVENTVLALVVLRDAALRLCCSRRRNRNGEHDLLDCSDEDGDPVGESTLVVIIIIQEDENIDALLWVGGEGRGVG